ncbi:hypothetical protein QJS10_CPA01g02687 [Acorus calamus]|uniref:Ubiquitin-like domain-containing protein n=1 Tax=Acorus calamus TaxID=4465 RepID=A0AAV9FL67_ACOCL|nr:hypothetical protein QJS10_CPA01g02687 [Acorus calamus]
MISVTVVSGTSPDSAAETLTGEFRTVEELKQEVERVWGIMHHRLLLVHDGKLMHDARAELSHYGVVDGASIGLYQKAPDNKPVKVTVEHHDDGLINVANTENHWSIKDLKCQIDSHIGVPPHRQRLEYMGAVMEEHERMNDYLIDETPTVKLIELPQERERSFFINVVNMLTEEHEIMRVEERDTVSTVRVEMQRRCLNGGKDFFLMFNWNRLRENSSMEDNRIKNGDLIQLVVDEVCDDSNL